MRIRGRRILVSTIGLGAMVSGCSASENAVEVADVRESLPGNVAPASTATDALSFEKFRQGQAQSFDLRDKNKDGIVALAELEPRYRKQFKRMDGDKDSRVTRAELEQSVKDRFKLADQNGDGVLQPAEWQ